MTGKWILPFQGRNTSLSMNQNFLWKFRNIYVMDNHRAALWCWMQVLRPDIVYKMFHIDAHYDCAVSHSSEWLQAIPDIRDISFADYLSIVDPNSPASPAIPAIRWDNYLSLFLEKYASQINALFTATHLVGTKPAGHFEEVMPYRFPSFFREYVIGGGHTEQWILNLDLDYFFCHLPNKHGLMFASAYVAEVFSAIRCGIRDNRFALITVCLSPECCGGWAPAEQLCANLFETLEIEFSLPA